MVVGLTRAICKMQTPKGNFPEIISVTVSWCIAHNSFNIVQVPCSDNYSDE